MLKVCIEPQRHRASLRVLPRFKDCKGHLQRYWITDQPYAKGCRDYAKIYLRSQMKMLKVCSLRGDTKNSQV